jgi:hypothetical protein
VTVLDMWHEQNYATQAVTPTLAAGEHNVVMESYEHGDYARATLDWS